MFIETAAAMFALGFLACLLLARAETTRLRREVNALRRAGIRGMQERREAHEAGTYRGQLRAVHHGTPYIAPLPTEVERLLVDIAGVDDHLGSRKAPELRVVS